MITRVTFAVHSFSSPPFNGFDADISLLFSNLEIEMIALLFIFLGLELASPLLNLDVDGRGNEFSEAASADGTRELII